MGDMRIFGKRSVLVRDIYISFHVYVPSISVENFKQVAIDISDQERGLSHISPIHCRRRSNPLTRAQLRQNLARWVSPSDPSSITILQTVHVTRTLRCDSFRSGVQKPYLYLAPPR